MLSSCLPVIVMGFLNIYCNKIMCILQWYKARQYGKNYCAWKIPILSAWPRACLLQFSTVRLLLQLRSTCMYRWRKWAQSLSNINVLPVKPVHLALYLQHLGDFKQSRAAVEEATYAIAWIHQMAGLPSPSSNPLVYRVCLYPGVCGLQC